MGTLIFKNENLEKIEDQIAFSIKSDSKSWKISYTLIKRVETESLWKEAGYHSFSDWVKHMAEEYGITEMAIWKIKSAGDSYERYEKSAKETGYQVASFSNNKLAIDTIILLNRMGQGDRQKTDSLMHYAQKHSLSKRDISLAWGRTRKKMEDAGVEAVRQNQYGQYQKFPDGIDPLEILEKTVYPDSTPNSLSDHDIIRIVHQYLGANVHRTTLENALREYANWL